LGRSGQQGALCAPVPWCVGWWCVGLCGVGLSVWRWGGVPGGASRGQACARREALGRKGFRAARWGGKGVRLQCSLRPGPAGARWLGWRWGWGRCGGGCSVCAGFMVCRFVWGGSVGLAMGAVCLVGLHGARPALAGRLWGGRAFALRAGEERVFASNARFDPAPRAPGGWGGDGVALGVGPLWRRVLCVRRFHGVSVCVGWGCRSGDGVCMPGGASRGRACARREALGRKGFRAARWGGKGVRLQCSLRPGPAGARRLGWRWSRAPE
jgi:hypothetical protein